MYKLCKSPIRYTFRITKIWLQDGTYLFCELTTGKSHLLWSLQLMEILSLRPKFYTRVKVPVDSGRTWLWVD